MSFGHSQSLLVFLISDSLEHRAQVRQTLASDSSWIANYFSKILPMMTRQENALLQPKGDLQLTQPEMKGKYY